MIRYVVLGLLTQQSMTGYAIKAMFDGLAWLVDSPSYGSLYPILHTLLELEWVTVEVVPNKGKPPRKVYSIAEAGKNALHEWLHEPVTAKFSVKFFVMRLMLAGCLSRDEVRTYLTLRKNQIMGYLSENKRTSQFNGTTQDLGWYLVDDYSMALARAELDWLEDRLAQLEQGTMTFGGLERTGMSE